MPQIMIYLKGTGVSTGLKFLKRTFGNNHELEKI